MNIDDVKDLTFYMGDKTDEELWEIVQEACRGGSREWRAYERLRGRFTFLIDFYQNHHCPPSLKE